MPLISNNHSHSYIVANESAKRKAMETACERPPNVIRTVLGDQDDFDVTSSDTNNVMDREPNCDNAGIDFIPFGLFSCILYSFLMRFLFTLFSCIFMHYKNAFSSSINAFS